MDKNQFEKIYDESQARFLEEWKQFLRFKSISTDPAFNKECRECAQWLSAHLQAIGFESKLLETPSKPVVYAHYKGKTGSPRVLYYGHYDVQPVDPEADWQTPPFEPELRSGRLYARGAQDNKGQTFYVIKALETLIKQKNLTCDVTLLIEGEEESGSEGISQSLAKWKDLVQADAVMVCDTGALEAGVPFVTMGLRGLIKLEVTLGGIHHDLHSGALGGVVRNPATELCRLIASLHKPDGSIAIEGYYDEVRNFSAEDRMLANRAWIDDKRFKAMIGVEAVGGEKSFQPAERRGLRPTIEINGMYSGYQGPGTKTIIPSFATAKITSRLVANQNPTRCLDLLVKHIENHAPKGLTCSIKDPGVGGPAVALSSQDALVQKASKVLKDISGGKVEYTWEGGSIPIVAELVKISGGSPLLVGFGLEEDRIHAPNESFALTQFKLGFLYACLMLTEFT